VHLLEDKIMVTLATKKSKISAKTSCMQRTANRANKHDAMFANKIDIQSQGNLKETIRDLQSCSFITAWLSLDLLEHGKENIFQKLLTTTKVNHLPHHTTHIIVNTFIIC